MTLRDLDEVLTPDNQEIVVGKWYDGDPFNPDNASEILWNGFVVDVLNCKYVDCEIKDLYISRNGEFIVSLSEEDVDKFAEDDKVEKYGKRVKKMLDVGYTVSQVLGCIYGLFEDYEINETTEAKLYEIADPRDEYNEPAEYWNKWNYDNYLELDEIPRTAESEMNRVNGIASKASKYGVDLVVGIEESVKDCYESDYEFLKAFDNTSEEEWGDDFYVTLNGEVFDSYISFYRAEELVRETLFVLEMEHHTKEN